MKKLMKKIKTGVEKINVKLNSTKNRIKVYGTYIAFTILTNAQLVHATSADSAWNGTMGAVIPWIKKIGVVAIVFGGVEFAIANSSEDANQKTRATRFMISGAIVLAVIEVVGPLLTQ